MMAKLCMQRAHNSVKDRYTAGGSSVSGYSSHSRLAGPLSLGIHHILEDDVW